jgi:hypothetical protein
MGLPAGSISSSMCVSTRPKPDIARATKSNAKTAEAPALQPGLLKMNSPWTDLNQPLV